MRFLKKHLPKGEEVKGYVWPAEKVLLVFEFVLKALPENEREGFLICLASSYSSDFLLQVECGGDLSLWEEGAGRVFSSIYSMWGEEFVFGVAEKSGEEVKKILHFKRT